MDNPELDKEKILKKYLGMEYGVEKRNGDPILALSKKVEQYSIPCKWIFPEGSKALVMMMILQRNTT